MGRPRTPTEDEIAEVLADARKSDPAGYSYDDYYYSGYNSDEEEEARAPGPSALPRGATGDILGAVDYPLDDFAEGDVAIYYHPGVNVWLAFPAKGERTIQDVVNDEGTEGGKPKEALLPKRDRLRNLGIRIIKRVKRGKEDKDADDKTGKVGRITRLKRRFTRKRGE